MKYYEYLMNRVDNTYFVFVYEELHTSLSESDKKKIKRSIETNGYYLQRYVGGGKPRKLILYKNERPEISWIVEQFFYGHFR